MIAYIFFKESKIIIAKIDNIEYISDNDKEIRGSENSIKYGDSQDYICLETDSINLNVGDMIDNSNLIDEREYFFNKEQWYQKQIKKANESIKSQQTTTNELQYFTLDLQYQMDTK